MTLIYFFLKRHMLEIFFVYGLVFFVMGLAIMVQYRHRSAFQLATSLRYLAAFGILHGLGEWGSIFIPLQQAKGEIAFLQFLQVAQRLLWVTSFAALLAFGIELAAKERYRRQLSIVIPSTLFFLWFINFVIYRLVVNPDYTNWIDVSEIWGRYLLGLPGLILATYVLIDQYRVLRPFNPPDLTVNLVYLAALFGIYTLLGGLIVPDGDFFPARWLNTSAVLSLTFIPVQVFRTICGMGMSYFTIRLLKIFNLETDRRLEEAERQRSIVRERERISRDLHDGVIQRIYGAGLILETALYRGAQRGEVDSPSIGLVRDAMGQLNETIDDLRRYLMALEPVRLQEPNLAKGLERIVADFLAHSFLPIELHVADSCCMVPPEEASGIYHVVMEALQNVRRHSEATAVRIDLLKRKSEFEVIISDNGVGFDPEEVPDLSIEHGHGLHNMQQRASTLSGNLFVESEPGRGTTVHLVLPAKG